MLSRQNFVYLWHNNQTATTMISLPESFFIFFTIIVFAFLIKARLDRSVRKYDRGDTKRELAYQKERLKFVEQVGWLTRVAGREQRRLEKRLDYLYRLRKKAVKRFGDNTPQVALIDRWITEVRRYMVQFDIICDAAINM